MPDAKASGADASNGSARSREHNQGNQERKYTVEQKEAVLRIRRCKATAFYEILEIQKTCSESEVKKAYRKQSLLTHPDKNGHEHADEAFKMVSRAFSVLGDKEKREKFDRFGTDPDSRFASAQAQNPFANRGQGAGGGMGGAGRPMWEDEISPEEMFARFFGGGGFGGQFGGGGFDTGPQFVFNFGGGPGIRVHQFGGARPRRRPRDPEQQREASLTSTLIGLLPILFLFILPLLSSIFSGGSSQPAPIHFSLDKASGPYTEERTMPNLKEKYYVKPVDVQNLNAHRAHQLDRTAEVKLINQLSEDCEAEKIHQSNMRFRAQGWFYQDADLMMEADKLPMKGCKRLNSLSQRAR